MVEGRTSNSFAAAAATREERRTLVSRPTNLPTETSPLVGRDRELDDVVALFAGRTFVARRSPDPVGRARPGSPWR